MNESQQKKSAKKNRSRHPEMNVGENAYRAAASRFVRADALHATPVGKTDWSALYTGDNRENRRRLTGRGEMERPEVSDNARSKPQLAVGRKGQ